MGGLGNQMFQYALGRRLSITHHTDLKVDIQDLMDRSPKDYSFRELKLNEFNIDLKIAGPEDRKKFYLDGRTRPARIKGRLLRSLSGHHIYYEPTNLFAPEILKAGKNAYMAGYWQTEKYFNEIRPALLADFQPKNPVNGTAEAVAVQIKSSESVSIHVRRGDYVHNKAAADFLGACSLKYYENAMEMITRTIKEPRFFIFSDDVAWVKENLHIDYPSHIMENFPDHVDMHLMSLCKHNIIANSSFSWWAAWLNPNQSKMVIYPRKWHKDATVDSSDMIPPGWQNAEN